MSVAEETATATGGRGEPEGHGRRPSLDGLAIRRKRVPNRSAVFDAEAVAVRLAREALAADDEIARRAALLAVCKDALRDGVAEIRRRFEANNDGAACVRAHCWLMDRILQTVADFAAEHAFPANNLTDAERIAVAAVGGYGRGELAPESDVDLLFLRPYKQTARGEQLVEFTLYLLWDLGLKVGHATRSTEDCVRQAKSDMTIRTAMLEARHLWGDEALYAGMRQAFFEEVASGSPLDFVEAKLAESDERHRRLGDSRYVVEPNVKDGKGGLRDLHTLFWIGKYAYRVEEVGELVARDVLTAEEARRFAKAQKLIWTIRCHLHYLTGRPEERLTFDLQPVIAERLGYTDRAGAVAVERFMKHYFLTAKDVGDLTRIFCASIEAQFQRRRQWLPISFLRGPRTIGDFRIESDRISVLDEQAFERDPVNILRLFHEAQARDVMIHPQALRLITQTLKRIDKELRRDPEANRLFLEMLTSPKEPARILRRMNEAQVLGRFLPDFGRVVAQMQFDMYHLYTVDEHTIQCIGVLSDIEKGRLKEIAPIATEVVHKVLSRRALYVAMLLHDIAKGRGGDHSVLGERVARRLCPRLGMTDEETDTVAWLVRWHLLMSNTAFKRDINDPKTVEDFAKRVQSPERLRLLLVLTVADIRGVGPHVWNGWKAQLLRDLYHATLETLLGQSTTKGAEVRAEAARLRLRDALAERGWEAAAIEAHLALGYQPYWLAFDLDSHLRHAEMIRAAHLDDAELSVDTRVDSHREVTEVTVYVADHPGLFSRIAGAMAAVGANVVDARISTLSNGMALDSFMIQDQDRTAFDRPDRRAKLVSAIERTLSGQLKLEEAIAARRPSIPKRTRALRVPPRVLIDDKASVTHTVVEVNARDEPGVLWRMTRALARCGVQIHSAAIATYGERFVDVFYVKDVFGLKIESETKRREIREALLAVLDG